MPGHSQVPTTAHPFRSRFGSALALTAASVAALTTLAACGSDPAATTCDEFAAMSESQQYSVMKALLKKHDKEDGIIMGAGNRQILESAIQRYCVIFPMGGDKSAHANNSSSIDNAANWA